MTDPSPKSRWILYHGTTTLRLKQIRQENALRVSCTGDPKVALTPDRSVAEYFSFIAVAGDQHDRPGEITRPVILVLDGEALALRHTMEAYSDNFWGKGECDWENEIACWDDVEPLHEVLIRIEEVPLDAYEVWQNGGSRLFHPARPWISDRIKARNAQNVTDLCDDLLQAGQREEVGSS
jgi:hypothetical protein